MEELRKKKGFICDMDGVIYHGNRLLPGVKEFVEWLYREQKNFLFLTNSSERSPKELQQKLHRMGLDVDESHFYTSALATARFISSQAPGCSAYVIGGAGLIMALHDEGITMNDVDPDYVIIGEGNTYNYENILRAVRLVSKGAKLIGTNSDLTGPSEDGIIPACRAMISPIEMATGKQGYICDMDGVIYHGDRLLPGVKEFVEWLYRENKQFLFLTNGSGKSPRELQLKLINLAVASALV